MKRINAIWILLATTLLLALGTGFPVYFRIFFLVALLITSSFTWAFLNLIGVTISANRTYAKPMAGESIETRITIHNAGLFPKSNLEIADLSELPGHNTGAVVNLSPGEYLTLRMDVPLRKRGHYRVGAPTVASRDPFGIFQLRHNEPGTEHIVVTPYMVDIPPFSMSKGDSIGDGSLQRNVPESTASVSTIRNYQPGDSTKYIHWPATANKATLMLKQFDGGMENIVWILLDLQSEVQVGDEIENTEESSITAAASIARSYSDMGWSVGLMANGDRHYILPPEKGPFLLDRMLFALAEARAEGTIPLRDLLSFWQSHVNSSNVSLIVITPSIDSDWEPLLEACIQQGTSASVVMIDPISFGSEASLQLPLGQLQRMRVPTYLVKNGEDLSQALQHSWQFTISSGADARPKERS